MPMYVFCYCSHCGASIAVPLGKPRLCDSCREQQKAAEVRRDTTPDSEPTPPKDAA